VVVLLIVAFCVGLVVGKHKMPRGTMPASSFEWPKQATVIDALGVRAKFLRAGGNIRVTARVFRP
jgi:hypothetical protein